MFKNIVVESRNQTSKNYSSALLPNSSTPISTAYSNKSEEIKQEIQFEESEMNTDGFVHLAQGKAHVPSSSYKIPRATKVSKDFATPNFSKGPIRISVKSKEKINAEGESSFLPAEINESCSSLVESTQHHVTHLQTQADLSSSNEEESTPNGRVRGRSALQSPVGALSCGLCKEWSHSSKLFWCMCQVVCQSCKKNTDNICSECHTEYKTSIRFKNFHQRVADTITHPCRYPDCPQDVRPGIDHEQTCTYIPVKCFKCRKDITLANLKSHYEYNHSIKVLTDKKNSGIKYSDFVRGEEAGGCREIFCFVDDLILSITLTNADNKLSFIVVNLKVNETSRVITITFEFQLDVYVYKEDVKIKDDNVENSLDNFVLRQKVFNDWFEGKSKLNITVAVKQRRASDSNPAKKQKKV